MVGDRGIHSHLKILKTDILNPVEPQAVGKKIAAPDAGIFWRGTVAVQDLFILLHGDVPEREIFDFAAVFAADETACSALDMHGIEL